MHDEGVTFKVTGFSFLDDKNVILTTKSFSLSDPVKLIHNSIEGGHIFKNDNTFVYCEFGPPKIDTDSYVKNFDRLSTVNESNVCLAIKNISHVSDDIFEMNAVIVGPLADNFKDYLLSNNDVFLGTRILYIKGQALIKTIDVVFSSKRLVNI